MPVKVQRKLHRVEVAYLHRLIEEREDKVLAIWRELDSRDLIRCLYLFKEIQLIIHTKNQK